METVRLDNLTIGYTTKGHQKVVARELTASIEQGELTCLLGQNGVGKSTLLRTLSAFQPAMGGEIWLTVDDGADGRQPERVEKPLSQLTDKQLSRLVGVVLTEKPDVRNMTVEELVGMGRSPYTGFWGSQRAEDRAVVRQSISMTGIEALTHRMVHTLSDGERQKVMIAKALAQETPIIYLDEPTAFLDFPSKVETMQLLHRLARGGRKTIFLSTHDVELALQVADRIWLLEPDHLSVGTPRQLAASGVLARFVERRGITFNADTLTISVKED